jgi:CheY-like chemotaxis protein
VKRSPDVLVVDDDVDICEIIALVLDANGYVTSSASDGWAALDHLQRHGEPGLILLDLRMPRMDGRELMKAMKSDPRFARIPVVVVSGEAAAMQAAAVLGADGCLQKPVDLDSLLATVARFAESREPLVCAVPPPAPVRPSAARRPKDGS